MTTYEANVVRPAQAIVEKFRQSVVKLSLKMHGCRVIQKALLSPQKDDGAAQRIAGRLFKCAHQNSSPCLPESCGME